MMYYAITWKNKNKEINTDLIKTKLGLAHLLKFYMRQPQLNVLAITEVVPFFSELTIDTEDKQYMLEGIK